MQFIGCMQALVCTLEQQATFSNTENLYQSYQQARPRLHHSMRKLQFTPLQVILLRFHSYSTHAEKLGAQRCKVPS